MIKWILIVCILVLSGLTGFIISWHHYEASSQEKLFIPPDVSVIETFHYPALFAKQLEHDKDAGRKIFNQFCTSCHGRQPTIDINAPRIGDKQAWYPRKKMGLEVLLKVTATGVGAMPARGGCFECTDDELQQAVKYILDHSD